MLKKYGIQIYHEDKQKGFLTCLYSSCCKMLTKSPPLVVTLLIFPGSKQFVKELSPKPFLSIQNKLS